MERALALREARLEPDRRGPLAPDATEMILVRLGAPLRVDERLLPATGR